MMIMRNCWNKMRWMERKDLCVLSCLRSYLLRQSTLVVVTLVVTGCESNLLGAANHLSGSLAGNAQDAQDTKNEQKLAQSQKKSLKMPPSSVSKTGKFTPKISDSPLPGVTSSKKTPKVLTDAFIAKGTDYKPRTHHLLASGAPKYINRLILESSPYLLQHAHNPVNWYPWGDEPFARAQAEGKLVFMSIGYSTCHWCHVMERESFENDDIARFLNENFICIKVDREERPDVDSIYMSAVTMLTGRGGWPMTTVLLPRSREPIFGGTYFPPKGNRYGRPSLTSVLQNLLTEYKSDPNTLQARGAEISAKMQAMAEPRPQVGMPDEGALISLAEQQKSSFDPKWGGFGRAPKFPRPSVLLFLLRYYRRSNDPKVLEMVTVTLDKMAEGGMHDQLGGGFHRYSTDQRWLVPHFEKMLYDNSQLTIAYIEALQATGKKRFGEVARHTLDYVLAEMTDPTEGTFYSATDADSPVQNGGHDEEGLFFTWTPEELIQALGKQKSAVFADFYGVKSGGNFEGRSILHRLEPASVVASRHHLTEQKLNILITDAKKILYPIRAKRLSPLLDDKVIAGWNGLMISALAKGAMALDNDRYLKAALRAGSFIWDNMVTDDRLSRVWHQGKRGHAAVLDDYGFFIAACLDLYEASRDPIWIKRAKALQTVVDTEFADFNNGGYFMTSNLGEKLLTREKSNYDGAIPAGNSYVLNNLLRLYEYTGDTLYREGAVRGFRVFNGDLRRRGRALPQMLSALDMYLDRPLEIVIVAPDTAGATPFVREVNKRYLPNKTLSILVGEGQSERHGLEIPLVQDKVARGGKPTAYVCRNNVCELPATDISVFRQQLSQVDLLKGALRR